MGKGTPRNQAQGNQIKMSFEMFHFHRITYDPSQWPCHSNPNTRNRRRVHFFAVRMVYYVAGGFQTTYMPFLISIRAGVIGHREFKQVKSPETFLFTPRFDSRTYVEHALGLLPPPPRVAAHFSLLDLGLSQPFTISWL